MLSAESEELQSRIEELKNENKMTEDALTKTSMTNSLQVSNLNTEITILTSQYEKERASKEKVDAEVRLKNMMSNQCFLLYQWKFLMETKHFFTFLF